MMRARVAFLFGLLTAACLAEPFFNRQDMWTAHEGGYDLYRIPGLIATPGGTVLAFCEARMESDRMVGADWARIDLLMRRSVDGGKTWDPPRKVVTPPDDVQQHPISVERGFAPPGQITCHNIMPVYDRDTGVIHFLYCIEYERCFYMYSEDDGLTFTDPVEITASFEPLREVYPWRVLATGPGHGIQLKNGRLLVPVWLSTGELTNGHNPNAITTVYSDDHGATWRVGEIVMQDPEPKHAGEPVAVELTGGRVLLNVRNKTVNRKTRERFRAIVTSPDGISKWSSMRYDNALPEPVCFGSILRHPSGPILFANPNNPDSSERKNLTVRLSYDECDTWPVRRTIEPGRSGYSDLAAAPDGAILCLYERGSYGKDHLTTAYISLARFNIEWLSKNE